MSEANKNTEDRENLHPVQNVNFRFVWFNYKIRYGDKETNGRHECDSLERINAEYCNNCQQNSLIKPL